MFNPWDDIKSKVATGLIESDMSSFIAFIEKNSISSSVNIDDMSITTGISILKDLDIAMSEYFSRVIELDIIYEKHKFRAIISKPYEDINQDSIVTSNEALILLNRNILKITNLLKNAVSTSTNNCLVIPYDLRFRFVDTIKHLASALSESSDFSLLNEFKYLNIKNVEKSLESLRTLMNNLKLDKLDNRVTNKKQVA